MIKFYRLLLFVGLFACTSDCDARKTLQAQGYSNIEITGYAPMSCSDDDTTCTGFKAVGPTGVHVEGAVGCGVACKGCTVRIK